MRHFAQRWDEALKFARCRWPCSCSQNAFRVPDISAEAARWFSPLTELTGNAVSVDSDRHSPLATTDSQLVVTAPFTFVGLMKLNSLYADATVRTIISQWDSNNKNGGWSIGVTSEKSAHQPRNFILQVVGDAGYEVVASDLRPELGKPYLVAVTVEQADSGKGKARFFLQPLDTKDGKLKTADVEFKSAAGVTSKVPVMLGGRHKQSRHKWDGKLDQVALFSKSLNFDTIESLFADQLKTVVIAQHAPVAAWDFDNKENPVADSSSHGHDLNIQATLPVSPLEKAVTELCHVLFNSNEFVYIDLTGPQIILMTTYQSRREMLTSAGMGFGALPLAAMLADSSRADVNPNAAKVHHRQTKAKSVIFLFMEGGPSHIDLFDPKPLLKKLSGQSMPESFERPVTAMGEVNSPLLEDQRKWAQHGDSGLWISDWLPRIRHLCR